MNNAFDDDQLRQRRQRIAGVLSEVRRRRAAGEDQSDSSLIEAHVDLLPELEQELRKLRLIESARQQAEQGTTEDTPTSDLVSRFCYPMPDHEQHPQLLQFSLATIFMVTFVASASAALTISMGPFGFGLSLYLGGTLLGVLAPAGKHKLLAVVLILVACVVTIFPA